jgi:hypothetical protein
MLVRTVTKLPRYTLSGFGIFKPRRYIWVKLSTVKSPSLRRWFIRHGKRCADGAWSRLSMAEWKKSPLHLA